MELRTVRLRHDSRDDLQCGGRPDGPRNRRAAPPRTTLMKRFAMLMAFVVCAVLSATPAFAADVDGKWSGTLNTPMGDVPIGFTFKADGTTLTGTTTGPDGAEIAIKNGKVDGAKISFMVSIDFGGMAVDINYTGEVKGGEIAMTLDFAGMPFNFTVKKS